MKQSTFLIIVVTTWICLITSCNKCKDVECVYGACIEGVCECDPGYTGSRCQTEINGYGGGSGGGSCDYVQSTQSFACADAGYSPVLPGTCCPDNAPYTTTDCAYCFPTCQEAQNDCSGTVYRANTTGSGGGGSSGYNCTSGDCVYVSSGATYSSLSACNSSCSQPTGQLSVWNSDPTPCPAGAGSTISVYINGAYAGGLSTYYNSAPSCGASGTVTQTLSPGSHTVSASCGSAMWGPMNVTVSSGGCFKLELN